MASSWNAAAESREQATEIKRMIREGEWLAQTVAEMAATWREQVVVSRHHI